MDDVQKWLRQLLKDEKAEVVVDQDGLNRVSNITQVTIQIQVFVQVGGGCFPRQNQELVESLTRQETVVLRLLADCLNNDEIAARLVVTRNTVKSHVSSILSKIGVRDRTEAAVWAIRNLDYESFELKAAA